MTEKIRKYIDELFMDAPCTRKALDLKEEMTLNTIEKYQDLVSEGYREEDAYQNVISSIGDVTELFADLEEPTFYVLPEEDRHKKSLLTAISVGMYIFAGAVFLLCVTVSDTFSPLWNIDFSLLGLVLTVVICIPPTCVLVYVGNMYPEPRKKNDSMVDLCKEPPVFDTKRKTVNASISAIIWTLTLALYFLISFSTHHWEVTWVIFLIGSCAQAILTLWNSLRKK